MHFKRLAVLVCALTVAGASYADTYPSQPIRLYLGYSPAGAADLIGRIVAEGMSKRLGQPIIVQNKPGAGGTIAANALANVQPDGYTLGLATANIFGLDQQLYKVSYSPQDLAPIMLLTTSPLVLAVNKDLGVNTVQDLIAMVKANPGKLNYSTSGVGGSPHIAALTFEEMTGGKMTHVPYKGGAPAITAVAGGEVDLSFGTASSVLPMGRQGGVKMLGVTTLETSTIAPDLKPIDDLGLPGFEYTFWYGLFGPAGLPEEVVQKLSKAAVDTLNDPEVKEKLLHSGNQAAPMASPAEFAKWAAQSGAKVLERAKKAKIANK